jgi:hypothetical protein
MDKLWRMAIVAVFAAGVTLRVAFLAAGPESLVRVVPDDAFYYFQIAEHIVAGNGSTFDGVYPANGFHPLWMMLLVPIAAFTGDPLTLLRFALGLNILFSALSALTLYVLLRRIVNPAWISVFAVYLYFLDPRTVASSLNGLETSLSTFVFSGVLYLTLCADRQSKGYPAKLGLALGLLLLARTDNAFFVLVVLGIALLRAAHHGWLRRALLSSGTLAAVVTPWLAWNWLSFGSPVQSSALAVPFVLHESYRLAGHDTLQMLGHSLELLVSFLAGPGLAHVLSGAAAAVSWMVAARFRAAVQADADRLRRPLLVALALWGAGILLIFSHTFWRWHAREWYFDQLTVLAALILSLTLAALTTTPVWARMTQRLSWLPPAGNTGVRLAIVVVLSLALLAPVLRGFELYQTGVFPHQTEMLDAAQWLRTHLTDGEPAAAFNAGIMAFFSGRRVINLDGAVNNAAFAAIRDRSLMALVRESGAIYYLDYDPVMLSLYAPFLGDTAYRSRLSFVQKIDRPDTRWNNSDIRVFRLKWLGP